MSNAGFVAEIELLYFMYLTESNAFLCLWWEIEYIYYTNLVS